MHSYGSKTLKVLRVLVKSPSHPDPMGGVPSLLLSAPQYFPKGLYAHTNIQIYFPYFLTNSL